MHICVCVCADVRNWQWCREHGASYRQLWWQQSEGAPQGARASTKVSSTGQTAEGKVDHHASWLGFQDILLFPRACKIQNTVTCKIWCFQTNCNVTGTKQQMQGSILRILWNGEYAKQTSRQISIIFVCQTLISLLFLSAVSTWWKTIISV